jgi:hypothetical protein
MRDAFIMLLLKTKNTIEIFLQIVKLFDNSIRNEFIMVKI